MHKISIILPIYNVAQYLRQCLDSVISQTYQNLEIILVNDGSTDSCPQICDEYASNDARVKVIHKENGGLSDARNAGMEIASGEFVSFVDSDDILSLDYCEKLFNALLDNNADIAECNFFRFEDEIELKAIKHSDEKHKTYDAESALRSLTVGPLNVMVWNKLYRREVLDEIEFPVGRINEDVFYTYKAFGNSRKVVMIPEVLYFYRKQERSIMSRQFSLKRLDGMDGLEEQIVYMKEKFPNLESLSIRTFCFAGMNYYRQISKVQEIDPQKIYRDKIAAKIKQYSEFSVWKNWYWKDIVWLHLWKISPKLYMDLRDYYDGKSEKFLNQSHAK